MNTYRTLKLDAGQFTMLHGKERHEVELVPELVALWFEWYADRDVVVWLYYIDGKKIPYANGMRGSFSVRTKDVLSVVLECTKSTTICVCASYEDIMQKEKGDPTKLTVAIESQAELSLSENIRRELIRLGLRTETLEVDEDEDNLENDIPEDDFGEGYMEDEEPVIRKTGSKKPKDAVPAGKDDAGVVPEPSDDSGPTPAP